MGTFLLLGILLGIATGMLVAHRAKAKRRYARKMRAARLRAARKPVAPLVSASLFGVTKREPAPEEYESEEHYEDEVDEARGSASSLSRPRLH